MSAPSSLGSAWAQQHECWGGWEEGQGQVSMVSEKGFQVGPSSGPRGFEGSRKANLDFPRWVPREYGPSGAEGTKQDLVICS